MERYAMQKLRKWKETPERKPLIIRGARQVGKTWLMKEFGKNEFARIAYVNFESLKLLKSLFADDFEIQRILTAVEIETGVQIEAENTLLIFDEIKEVDGAIKSLKYFHENDSQYHILAAGSLLGIAFHKKTSFPVGKVEYLDLFPLCYSEFLLAMDQKPLLDLLDSMDWALLKPLKQG
jgi:predicted AAA+ superfamily ATPase